MILEAFKIGTEPSRNSKQAVVRGAERTGNQRGQGGQGATVGPGTGGLY